MGSSFAPDGFVGYRQGHYFYKRVYNISTEQMFVHILKLWPTVGSKPRSLLFEMCKKWAIRENFEEPNADKLNEALDKARIFQRQ